MLFAHGYYESFLTIEDVIQESLTLHGSRNRVLISWPPAGPVFSEYIARIEPLSVKSTVEMTDLRAESRAVVRRFIERIFDLFNWNDVQDATLQDWQRQLAERRL